MQRCQKLTIHPAIAHFFGKPEWTNPTAGWMPAGLYVDMANHIIGVVVCINHIRIFMQHGAIGTSLLLASVVFNAIRWQCRVLASQDGNKTMWLNLLDAINSSLESGIRDQVFQRITNIQQDAMQGWVVLIAGYSTFGIQNLTRFEIFQIIASSGYTWWTLAKREVSCHLGDQLWQQGLALLRQRHTSSMPRMLLFLQIWCFANISGAISLAVMVCHIVGPLLAWVVFIPPAYATYRDDHFSLKTWCWAAMSCPLDLITFGRSSVFGIPMFDLVTFDDVGSKAAKPLCAANVARILLSAAMIRLVSFRIPTHLYSFVMVKAAFGNPSVVGWPRFQRPFPHFMPAFVNHTDAVTDTSSGNLTLLDSINLWSNESAGAAAWPDFLCFIIVVTLPVYMFGILKVARINPRWWNGGCDEDFEEKLLQVAVDILSSNP